jgi:signal peptidase II
MYPGQRIEIIGDFFRLTFIENPGMAFGYDPGTGLKLWISLFSLIASIGLLIYLYAIRKQSFTLRIAIAFILGGAAGNLIDRMFYGVLYDYAPLFYGKVVDFFDFDFFDISILGRHYERWPIFNIADAAVSIGVFILIFFYKKHHKETDDALDENQIVQTESGSVTDSSLNIEQNITEETNVPDNPGNQNKNGESDKGEKIQD